MLIVTLLTTFLIFSPAQGFNPVSDAQKEEFINLLKTLPTKGEFYTDKAVIKAAQYLPVLFALTEKDIENYDIYPFAALSRGLCEHEEHREYGVRNFAKIRHPELKLFWGVVLFDLGAANSEIQQFLKEALRSEGQAKLLSEIMGPRFESFKTQVLSK